MARICMVAYTQYPSDTRIRREAEALIDRGDSVDMLCLKGQSEQAHDSFHGVGVIRISVGRYRGSDPKMYLFSYLQFFLKASVRLAKLHLRNPYQVIQVHTMPDFMVFVAFLPRLWGAKVILDVHDLMPELYKSKFGYTDRHPLIRLITWVEHLSIGFAHRAIAVHKPHLETLCRHGNPPEKFTILLNLPDMKIFNTGRESSPECHAAFELIYHGTISKRHGLETAIRAVDILQGKIDQLILRIFGEGDDVSRLIDLVEKLHLQDQVKISQGMVPLDDLVWQIKRADVGIVPILYDDFTKYMLPVKLLEYVGLGMPVVCSRTETIEAYFNDSMIQFSTPGNAADLAQNILLLYQNPGRRRELIVNSQKFNTEYNWENQKLSYYQLIDNLV